jgi:hypothetical protein
MTENKLMERTNALVKEYGSKWTELTKILHSEGFRREDGTPLTVDTVKKRYARWTKLSKGSANIEERHPQENDAREEAADPETTAVHPEETERHDAVVPVRELLELFKGTLERRDAMLSQKLQADTDRHHTEERLASVEARLEEKLAKRLKAELAELVEDTVDRELKNMVTTGGSFERDLKLLIGKVIEEKSSGQLLSLIEGIDLGHEHRGGPGRGHKEKRAARFSATMDGQTYARMKDLPGTFSSHLTAACRLYLRALESKKVTC